MNLSKKVILFLLFAALTLGGCEMQSYELKVDRQDLIIPGLQEEYNILYITDSHVIVPDSGATAEEIADSEARYGSFQNEQGIPAKDMLPALLDYGCEQKVDAILLGGDIIDSPTEANVDYLTKQLGSLPMPYLYTPGNHDWTFPWEYMTDYGREQYLSKLAPLMGGNTACHAIELGELTLVAVDNSSNQVDEGALEQYKLYLEQGKPVILMCHVPLITQSVLGRAREVWSSPVVLGAGNYGGIYPNEISTEFMNLTAKESSPVAAILAGHVHFQDIDDYAGEKMIPQYVGDAGFNGSAILLHISGK